MLKEHGDLPIGSIAGVRFLAVAQIFSFAMSNWLWGPFSLVSNGDESKTAGTLS
jgi:hypothetical protein